MKQIIIIFMISILLSSCNTTMTVGDIRTLDVGMSRAQVDAYWGNPRRLITVEYTREGVFEVYEYNSYYREVYAVQFLNGFVVGYDILYKDFYTRPRPNSVPNRPNRPSSPNNRPNRPQEPDRPSNQPSRPNQPNRLNQPNKPDQPDKPNRPSRPGNENDNSNNRPQRPVPIKPNNETTPTDKNRPAIPRQVEPAKKEAE